MFALYNTINGEITAVLEVPADEIDQYVQSGMSYASGATENTVADTHWVSGGTLTAKVSLDTICAQTNTGGWTANGSDQITYGSSLPNPTLVSVYSSNRFWTPITQAPLTDGTLVLTTDIEGDYFIHLTAFPYLPKVWEVHTISTRDFAFIIAETETINAQLNPGTFLAPALSETEAITFAVGRNRQVSATITAAEALTAGIKRVRLFATTISAAETITAALFKPSKFAFTVSSAAAFSIGEFDRTRGHLFTLAELQVITPRVSRARAISTSIAETATFTPALGRTRNFSVSIAATETITADLTVTP